MEEVSEESRGSEDTEWDVVCARAAHLGEEMESRSVVSGTEMSVSVTSVGKLNKNQVAMEGGAGVRI